MASIKYRLKAKSDNSSIYLRLSLGAGKCYEKKTGLSVNSAHWSRNGYPKQTLAHLKNLKTKLSKLEAFIYERLNIASSDGINISANWLQQQIDLFFNRREEETLDFLADYGEYFLDNLKYKVTDRGKNGVSVSTHKKYRTIVNKIQSFDEFRGEKILLKDVNLDYRKSLMDYLEKEEKLSDNTIGRYLRFIKTICRDAAKNGHDTHYQLSHFKGFSVDSEKIVYTQDELHLLKDTDFAQKHHVATRDWVLIGCYTGQRISDLLRMKSSMIQNVQGFNLITLTQKKTGQLVQIPIHPIVQEILNKRGGEFPEGFGRKSSSESVLFNRYLKEISNIAGITAPTEGKQFDENEERFVKGIYPKYELVSSHICRRTFATQFYGDPKYPTPLLMNITGHTTEKMFLEYIGKEPLDYSLQMARIWANEY